MLAVECGPAKPGVVDGDSYIATETGATVDLAGMPVRVIEDAQGLDSIMMDLCPRRGAVTTTDSATEARAWLARHRFLGRRVLRTTRTDAQAHFRITLPAGRYRAWADTSYRGERWSWLARFEVRAGDTTKLALNNANPDENPFRCKH